MLVLGRHEGERVRLTVGGEVVWVQVVRLQSDRVRLGFSANRAVEVLREEVIGTREAATKGEANAEAS